MTEWLYDEQREAGELVVTGAVTVARVDELKPLLLEAIAQAPSILVDLGRVEEIDVAGLQLFCAAHRLAANGGKTFNVTTVGACVLQLVRTAGFVHATICDRQRGRPCLWGIPA
jgi:anti-anti-sigma factor